MGNFHFLSGKVLQGTTVDDDEAKNCDIKQNGEEYNVLEANEKL